LIPNAKVDTFFAKAKNWKAEMLVLRAIVLETGLVEELKWYQPCYTHNDKNVLIISSFKQHCVLSFIKGVLIKDDKKLLVSPGANSQSVMFAKFTSVAAINANKKTLVKYIKQAIAAEEKGTTIEKKKIEDYPIPSVLTKYFEQEPKFKAAFYKLTAGRQRGYLMRFSAAKQEATVLTRIEKYKEKILNGIGFNDR
jgi:uncharacterized protein YdeI (YjbR/CyaY-like superfamily)